MSGILSAAPDSMPAPRRYFKYTRMTLPLEYNTLSEHTVWRPATAADGALTGASAAVTADGVGAAEAAEIGHDSGWPAQNVVSGGTAGSRTGAASSAQHMLPAAGSGGGAARWWGRRRRLLWLGLTWTATGGAQSLCSRAPLLPQQPTLTLSRDYLPLQRMHR